MPENAAGQTLIKKKKDFDLPPELEPLPAPLQQCITELELTIAESHTEDLAQSLVTNIFSAFSHTGNNDGVCFFDTHASGLPDGHKPDGFIGYQLCWSKCVSIVEAKAALGPNDRNAALGQVAKRFRRIMRANPSRQQLVFFLFGSTEIQIGRLKPETNSDLSLPPFQLELSESLYFDPENVGDCDGAYQMISALRCVVFVCSYWSLRIPYLSLDALNQP